MAEEKNLESAETKKAAGSSENLIESSPSANTAGGELAKSTKSSEAKEEINLDDYIPKKDYEELERKLGEQGGELGELRTFFKGIEPILDKLQDQPEVVDAILRGEIDSELAKSILEGEVNAEDAKIVTAAHDKVKSGLGKDKYNNMDPEKIEKLVSEQVAKAINETKQSFKRDINTIEDKRGYEKSVENFVKDTTDFSDYAEDISKWLEDHPEQYDIETAYLAVKGKRVTNSEKEEGEKMAAEEAKKIALNAAGGQSQGGSLGDQSDVIDELIAGKPNPNTF